ncbi:hypothetical protein D3C87_1768120 [compost metagenome]
MAVFFAQHAGLQRITGNVQRRNFHAAAFQRRHQPPPFARVLQQRHGVQMRCRRPAAGGHFHAKHPQFAQAIQHGFKRQVAQAIGTKRKFHALAPDK